MIFIIFQKEIYKGGTLMKIAVAGTGCWSFQCSLLAQHNEVVALDIIQEKVDMINRKESQLWMQKLKSI